MILEHKDYGHQKKAKKIKCQFDTKKITKHKIQKNKKK